MLPSKEDTVEEVGMVVDNKAIHPSRGTDSKATHLSRGIRRRVVMVATPRSRGMVDIHPSKGTAMEVVRRQVCMAVGMDSNRRLRNLVSELEAVLRLD